MIDIRMRDVISSVTTALDEYRLLAAEALAADVKPEAGIEVPRNTTLPVVDLSKRLDAGLVDAQRQVAETTLPESAQADALKRQLNDTTGLNRLARSELQMSPIIVGWFRSVARALKNYPDLIRKTAKGIKAGTDVADAVLDRWHQFERNLSKFMLEEVAKTCDSLLTIADKLDQSRASKPETQPGFPDDLDVAKVREMLLAGIDLPKPWRPFLLELNLADTEIESLAPLATLGNLQRLVLSRTRVADLRPLERLTNLKTLHLTYTPVFDLSALYGLSNLQELDVAATEVTNIGSIANLSELHTLDMFDTKVSNISAVANLKKLERLDLDGTRVSDIGPLAGTRRTD